MTADEHTLENRISSDDVVIREMTIDDFPSCVTLWRAEGMAYESDIMERLGILVKRNPGLSQVAEINDELVGSVLSNYNGFTIYVFRLVVAPPYQKLGIGSKLMDAIESFSRDLKAQKVVVNVEPGLAAWYQQRGYRKMAADALYLSL